MMFYEANKAKISLHICTIFIIEYFYEQGGRTGGQWLQWVGK